MATYRLTRYGIEAFGLKHADSLILRLDEIAEPPLLFQNTDYRFRAEVVAAAAQGETRWQALEAVRDAQRNGNSVERQDLRSALARQQRSDDMSGVQFCQEEEDRSLPQRDEEAGRDRLVLLALRAQGRRVL